MYSILIDEGNEKWKFLTNSDGSKYIATSLVAVQEKVKEVLRETALGEILVVKNCTITESITVTENEPAVEAPQENEQVNSQE